METYTTVTDLPSHAKDTVLVIGNFDGIHKGHRALIKKAREIASTKNCAVSVLTFEPHPRRLFRPDDPPFRITPPSLKQEKLATCGIDNLFSLPFDWDFASQSAAKFIDTVLKKGIAPNHIVVGEDFGFGQLRQGNVDTLRNAGFDVTAVQKIKADSEIVYSSGAVRNALRRGDIDRANDLLGWEWEMRGIIVKGDQRGRELGYPTANVPLDETVHPAYGIYATMAKIIEDGPDAPWMPSATNIGIRPMFEVPVGQIECFIFDFDRDIYDCTLRIKPVKRLRGEAKFDSIEDLITQMEKDCDQARAILS